MRLTGLAPRGPMMGRQATPRNAPGASPRLRLFLSIKWKCAGRASRDLKRKKEQHRHEQEDHRHQPARASHRNRRDRAHGSGEDAFSVWCSRCAGGGSRDDQGQSRLHCTYQCSALFVAKDKGLFAKHGMPGVEVQKQASWGSTRDNLACTVPKGNGIDGAYILTPLGYLSPPARSRRTTCRC